MKSFFLISFALIAAVLGSYSQDSYFKLAPAHAGSTVHTTPPAPGRTVTGYMGDVFSTGSNTNRIQCNFDLHPLSESMLPEQKQGLFECCRRRRKDGYGMLSLRTRICSMFKSSGGNYDDESPKYYMSA